MEVVRCVDRARAWRQFAWVWSRLWSVLNFFRPVAVAVEPIVDRRGRKDALLVTLTADTSAFRFAQREAINTLARWKRWEPGPKGAEADVDYEVQWQRGSGGCQWRPKSQRFASDSICS
ncbi:MAG: hypothetical protein JWM11_7583 [Planctomycetaceae bacterium]|nr:hypothetical protein [Planctomycetaceae bacterium]